MPDEIQKPANKPGRGFLGWLGRQVGFVKKAIETDVNPGRPRTVYRDRRVEEKPLPEDPNVKLRRTVIDEVIVEPESEKMPKEGEKR